jgi:centrin-1
MSEPPSADRPPPLSDVHTGSFESDGNAINQFELKVALDSLGYDYTHADIERLILDLDPLNKGSIDPELFLDLIKEKMSQREEIDQIRMAFDMLDEDRTGKITFKNLKRVAADLGESLSDQEIHEMINEADADNDGEITFEEFVGIVKAAKGG